MKYLLIRDTNIEGHCMTGYCVKNGNGKFSFVVFAESAAHRFDNVDAAYKQKAAFRDEKGYAIEGMHVIESSTPQTMVMPL